MAKFLDKKERVYDLKLTTYGRHLLSRGTFKPAYYAFFDAEILYDKDYARSGVPSDQLQTTPQLSGTAEPQNDVHDRIKDNTQYLEGFVNFREVEETPEYVWNDSWWASFSDAPYEYERSPGFGALTAFRTIGLVETEARRYAEFRHDVSLAPGSHDASMIYGLPAYYTFADLMPPVEGPLMNQDAYFDPSITPDFFRFESSIGDAVFDGKEQQHAPAWKVVTLQGQISSSASEDISHFYRNSEGRNEQKIPQINIDLNYAKKVHEDNFVENPNNIPQLVSRTETFVDGNVIELVRDDLVIYADELNTMLLTENFDIEVFESEDIDHALPATGKIIRMTGAGAATAGDTITINDGVTSATFEFIVDGGTPTDGNIGVVISSGYDYFEPPGGSNDRFGTMENLVAAINQSLNLGWNDGGVGGTARCTSPYKCYTGTHSLNVTANDGGHSLEWTTPVSDVNPSSYIVINITNHVGGTIANEAITSTVSDAAWDISGFSGGFNKVTTSLVRKRFAKEEPQVINGMMVSQNKKRKTTTDLSTSDVEYYFDIFTDQKVDRELACRGASIFNKESYYVDLDFECSEEDLCADEENILYDIYGNAVGDTSDIC